MPFFVYAVTYLVLSRCVRLSFVEVRPLLKIVLIVVLDEESLRRILRSYIEYYHDSRCHLALNKDSPEAREVQPPATSRIVEIPKVGGLHHRYERRAA
jgi:hypothetical protein